MLAITFLTFGGLMNCICFYFGSPIYTAAPNDTTPKTISTIRITLFVFLVAPVAIKATPTKNANSIT